MDMQVLPPSLLVLLMMGLLLVILLAPGSNDSQNSEKTVIRCPKVGVRMTLSQHVRLFSFHRQNLNPFVLAILVGPFPPSHPCETS